MAYEVKDENGDTTKLGGKITGSDHKDQELTDWSEYPPMPPAPSQKYLD